MAMRKPADWHRRYQQQAGWTRSTRRYLFDQLNFAGAHRILDVGCGTGALFPDLLASSPARVIGLDIDFAALRFAHANSPVPLACGDALRLPFPDASFDIALCHFLLLWLPDPALALSEMARVTRPGGSVCVLAEPDYGGRIDFPPQFEVLGRLQVESLRRQGADPLIGRRLRALLTSAGLRDVQVTLIGGHWGGAPDEDSQAIEWAVLSEDLRGHMTSAELDALRRQESESDRGGERLMYVPTFTGWGRRGR